MDDFDDERTLDEEEDMEEGTDREEEIDNLEKVSCRFLLILYNNNDVLLLSENLMIIYCKLCVL